MINQEFTQRLRALAKRTNFREVKDKINAYFTLHDEIDINNESEASLIMDALTPYKNRDKEIYNFCKIFENRKALRELGISAALTQIQKTKIYSVNDKIKSRVDELVAMKHEGVAEIKIFEAYKNEVQGLVLDNFFNKYMSDVDAKYDQFKAYAFVDETLEELSHDPNPELLDGVFSKLEGAMALPASQVPFYLIKALSPDRHLSPAIDKLLFKLKAIDPMSQRNTMNQIRYVGNAGIYESVLAPVKFGESKDTVMLGNRLFNISESEVCEPEEGEVDEAFVGICRAFAHTGISESGALSITDENNNVMEIDENADGLNITLNKIHHFPVDKAKEWQTELLAMQVDPGAISVLNHITENLGSIVSMDNIISLSSKTGNNYSMYLIKQGNSNHMIITDPLTGGFAINKNISIKEAISAAMDAFGADVSKFFGEAVTNEDSGVDAQLQELEKQVGDIEASIEQIKSSDEETQTAEEVKDLLEKLEKEKEELCAQCDKLREQLAIIEPGNE